jgi:hypothetical protein
VLEKAISKIQSEIDQNKNNPYIQVVGGFLLMRLEENPDIADKILTDDKTIAKSLDEMRKAAEKKKVGNCAVLTDQEGFEVVLKYFGINSKVVAAAVPSVEIRPEPASEKKVPSFDVSLDDLL